MEKKDLNDLVKAINAQTMVQKDLLKYYDKINRVLNENVLQLKSLSNNINNLITNLSKQ